MWDRIYTSSRITNNYRCPLKYIYDPFNQQGKSLAGIILCYMWLPINDITATTIQLAYWSWDKMAAISQTMFANAFFWMKMQEFRLKFHGSLILKVQLTILQHLFGKWRLRRPGDKPLSASIMVKSPAHICVTLLQWVKWAITYHRFMFI